MAVLCGQRWISGVLEAKSGIGAVPVIAIKTFEPIIVQVYMKIVHFVIRHQLNVAAQKIHSKEFPSAIEHKSSHGKTGKIPGFTGRDVAMHGVLFKYLEQS